MKILFFFCPILCSLQSYALAPEPIQNYVPVVLVDSSQLGTPGSIYFIAHGLDPCGLPCYLVPNTDPSSPNYGLCEYIYPNTSGTPSSANPTISKTLDQFPPATGTGQTDPAYLIYLPIDSSARGYLSIDNPMYLATQFNPAPSRMVLDIIDSSVTNIQDSNYYTWYQDFEFGLVYISGNSPTGSNLQSQLFLNLSWVDYFALPMKLGVFSYPNNQQIQGTSTLVSGFNPSLSRDQIIQDIQTGLSSEDTPGITTWSNLSIPYYQNQYTNGASPEGYLRILAAKNSIALSTSTQFEAPGTGAQQLYFPSDYVHNVAYGPTPSTTFMEAVYTYYTTNTLTTQIFPAGGVPTIAYTYEISATPGDPNFTITFTYTGTPPPYGPTLPSTTLALKALTTEELLSGSLWPFSPNNVSITNELSKLISALFTIGQLPLNTAQLTATPPADYNCIGFVTSSTIVNNNCGFSALAPRMGQTNSYFNNPQPAGFTEGPWFNVYDELVHANQISTPSEVPNNPSFGLGYGYDYDDLLNMAGLIDPTIQDQYGNPTNNGTPPLPDAYIVVTLGNLTGSPVLNINNDTYTTNPTPPSPYNNYQIIPYPVYIGALSANSTMTVNFIWFDGTTQHTTPAPTSGQTQLPNIVADPSHPFQIQFGYNGVTYTYTINLLRQNVSPSSPTNPYSSVDVGLIDGITFLLTAGPELVINISSVAPPWQG